MLVAASRVLKHTAAEKGKRRAESMLDVCGDLIDLDTACLTIKILKHVSRLILEQELNTYVCHSRWHTVLEYM